MQDERVPLWMNAHTLSHPRIDNLEFDDQAIRTPEASKHPATREMNCSEGKTSPAKLKSVFTPLSDAYPTARHGASLHCTKQTHGSLVSFTHSTATYTLMHLEQTVVSPALLPVVYAV